MRPFEKGAHSSGFDLDTVPIFSRCLLKVSLFNALVCVSAESSDPGVCISHALRLCTQLSCNQKILVPMLRRTCETPVDPAFLIIRIVDIASRASPSKVGQKGRWPSRLKGIRRVVVTVAASSSERVMVTVVVASS